MNEGFAFARRGREGDVVAASVIRRRRRRFYITHSTSLKYTIYNCTRSRAPSVAFTKCPSRERPFSSPAWRSCSPARASPRARTWSPARAPAAARAASSPFPARAPGNTAPAFPETRARAQVELGERVGPDHQRLDGGALLQVQRAEVPTLQQRLVQLRALQEAQGLERVRLHERVSKLAATRHVRGAQRRARRGGRAHETREPRRAPELDGRQTGRESFTTSAGKASCRVFVCVTRICGRFGEGRARSARRVRRARRKKKCPV